METCAHHTIVRRAAPLAAAAVPVRSRIGFSFHQSV